MSDIEDAVATAAAIRAGDRSEAEVLGTSIERIERIDQQLNAVVHRRFDRAVDEARVGLPRGPFRGVPLLVKDAVCHTAGDPFHQGMRLLKERGYTAASDSYLAQKFRRAGFVIVGRTNVPELATAFTTEPVAYGPTLNPWDTTRSAGGSSGGSAAAVAAGLVPVAHGNDMGGSIRVPASQCGLVGLKPTHGRISLGPAFGDYWAMLAHEGVMTRSVRDTAAVLDAISGPAPGDPSPAPPPLRPFADEVGEDPGCLRIGMRVEVPLGGHDAHPECVAAVESAAALLERLGHVVEHAAVRCLDDEGLGEPFGIVFAVAIQRELDRWSERLGVAIGPDDVEPRNWMLAEHGRGVDDAARYVAAIEYLQGYARRVAGWWDEGYDLLLTPTLPERVPPLGRLPHEPSLAQVADLGQFTSPFNVTGQPAISLPLHWDADGLPVGIQLAAAYGREDLLVRVASQLELAAPWAHRRPPER